MAQFLFILCRDQATRNLLSQLWEQTYSQDTRLCQLFHHQSIVAFIYMWLKDTILFLDGSI